MLPTISDEQEEEFIEDSDAPLNGEGPKFQQYLEEEGIFDYLTLEMLSLYKANSPSNGLDIFKRNVSKDAVRIAKLEAEKEAKLEQEATQMENEALKYRIDFLEAENKKLSLQIEDLKINK